MKNSSFALEVEGLCASYGSVPAIRDVSIKIGKGSIVTMIGANGAGKSTVIKSICGLLKPTRGTVKLFGEDVTGLSPDKLVKMGLAIVPEGRRLFADMSCQENLELGAYSRSDRKAVARDMERVLELFPDLRGRLSTLAGSFSGGQQQMLAVARALMSAPRVLLLDEPTIGIAPAVVERIAELIVEIAGTGVDTLLVEQNAEIALSIADRAYILEGGSLISEGPAEELALSETVQKAYLGI